MLFPIRLDDAVMDTNESSPGRRWVAKLRTGQRNIGDFRRWTDHNAYKTSFERIIRDLTQNSKRA
jgi:hypothetical protein